MANKNRDSLRFERRSGNVLDVRLEVRGEKWEQWFMLSSDRHHDSHSCNRELEIEHLEEARRKNAKVLDFGDLFDCMQGRYDPRRSYKEMRPEYLQMMIDEKKDYLDVIVKDAVKFYKPYADLFALVTRGNHETAIQKNNDTDLIERFVYQTNMESMVNICKGAYGGWVVFHFSRGNVRSSIRLKYFHGSGGGGPVTKGTIQSNRQAVFLPDAQIVVNGHIHESWLLAMPRERISDSGEIFQDMQHHVRTPTYKNDYGDGSGNWHVERGAPPKPMGCVWLRFYVEKKHIRLQLVQDVR